MFITADIGRTLINMDHVKSLEYVEDMKTPSGIVWAHMEDGSDEYVFAGDTDDVHKIMRALFKAIESNDSFFNFGIEHLMKKPERLRL